MSERHYEIRLEKDLADIKAQIANIAEEVSTAMRRSMSALERFDHEEAYRTIIDDNPINRHVETCDKACHHFVARHLPAARHLRFISSVMRLNIVLERVGDYAATICRVAVQLSQPVDNDTLDRIKTIAYGSTDMFEQAIKAFIEGSPELALGTMALEKQIDRSFHVALDHVMDTGLQSSPTTGDLFGKLVILSTLERVSDQAKNICEYAIFAEKGETKQRKPVPVIFLDNDNSRLGPTAVAIGRKAYPDHGSYSTASLNEFEGIDEDVKTGMDELGHELATIDRRSIGDLENSDGTYRVVVVLEGDRSDYLDSVAFNTVVLHWRLDEVADDFASLYKQLTTDIRELMTTLRGG